MSFIKEMFGVPDVGDRMERLERERQARINQGYRRVRDAFAIYTPEFYGNYAKAVYAAGLPQLAEQYRMGRDNTLYGLSNRGLTRSTMAQDAWQRLERERARSEGDLTASAWAARNELESGVENARSRVLAQLYQTAMPNVAGQDAIRIAASIPKPPTLAQSSANLFGNVANIYAMRDAINPGKAQVNTPSMYGTPPTSLVPSNEEASKWQTIK